MILIFKFIDNGKSLFEAGDRSRALYDKILIPYIPISDFPLFDITTESDNGDIARRRVGEFAIKLNLMQPEKSFKNKSILEFLRDTSRAYKFFFAMQVNLETVFIGTFKLDDISGDYNFNQGKASIQFKVRCAEEEFKLFLESRNSEFPGIQRGIDLTFEDYMTNYHLEGLTVELPTSTFAQKCGDNTVRFKGRPYRNSALPNYTIWSAHNRWITYQDLYKGLGFDFEIKLKNTVQQTYDLGHTYGLKDLLKINMFWKIDIINSPAIHLTRVLEHTEDILPFATKNAVFLRYHESVYENPDHIGGGSVTINSGQLTGIRGVLLTSDDRIYIANSWDTDNSSGAPVFTLHYPFFMMTQGNFINNPQSYVDSSYISLAMGPEGFIFNFMDPTPFPPNNGFLIDETYTVALNQFSCPANIFEHDELEHNTKAGVVSYPRFFCSSNDDFSSVAAFAISNYKRFLSSGNKKRKYITARLEDVPGINIYKKINLSSDSKKTENYFVSKITGLDLRKQRVSFELTEI